jgi:hypothetical protein
VRVNGVERQEELSGDRLPPTGPAAATCRTPAEPPP